jgi:uncharacterized repeat protein (TIGR01451 family)
MPSPRAAHAAALDYTWEFTNGADYVLSDGFMLANYGAGGASSALHFKVQNFSSAGLGTGLEGIATSLDKLLYDSDGTLWGTAGNKLFSSTDGGANWAEVTPTPGMAVYDIIENDYADGTPGTNLIATGSIGAGPAIVYSFDGGATWSPAAVVVPVGVTRWLAVTYDTVNDVAYAVSTGLGRVKSTNGGAAWTDLTPAGPSITINTITSPTDIVAYGADQVAIVGENGTGDGKINFSTDAGVNWSNAPIPGTPGDVTTAEFIGGVVYGLGTNYLTKIDIASGGTMDDAGDWSDISANLAGGAFASTNTSIIGGRNSNIVFLKVRESAGGGTQALFSSVDKGVNFNLHYEDPANSKMIGSIALNPAGDRMFWAGITPGDTYADLYGAIIAPANTLAITQVGPANVGVIASITANTQSLSYGEPKVSFGNTTNAADSWHYYDTGDSTWKTSTANDSSKATAVSSLTGPVLAGLPLTGGPIYLKIYTPSLSSTLVLDSLVITYDEPVPVDSITVTVPNESGLSWQIGTQHSIVWTSVGTIGNVKIELSRDNGATWATLTDSTPENPGGGGGSYAWEVTNPATNGATAKIKVTRVDPPAVTDMSDNAFAITVGPGGGGDETAPESHITTFLPRYSTAPDVCAPTLHLEADASDNGTLASVLLYVSTDGGNNFDPWGGTGMPDLVAPYTWDIDVVHDTTYYFYSIAKDTYNNLEGPPPSPGYDTMTTMDVKAPTVSYSTPASNDINVSISQPIVFTFSESLVPETFTYDFYKDTAQGNIPVAGAELTWSDNYTKITVTHPDLDYSTLYRFLITNATDAAGNQLNDVRYCRPPECEDGYYDNWPPGRPLPPPNPFCGLHINPPPPSGISFTTQARIDPDLLTSDMVAADGPNQDGSFNAGDEVQFTITLRNNSSIPADNVLVRIADSFPDHGFSYVRTDDKGGGTVQEYKVNGKVVKWEWWNGDPIVNGQPVVIKFTVKVDKPYLFGTFYGSVLANIYDNVNFTEEPDNPFYVYDTFDIAHNSLLTKSTISVTPTTVHIGDTVTYKVEIYNTGTTVGDIWFQDFVPDREHPDDQMPISYIDGSLSWDHNDNRWYGGGPTYDELRRQVQGMILSLKPGDPKVTLEFQAVVRNVITPPADITNTASVMDGYIAPPYEMSAVFHVEPGDPTPPLKINRWEPAVNSFNNPLKQPIRVGFNRSVNLDTFVYELEMNGDKVDLSNWTATWSKNDGGLPDTLLTLKPPTDDGNYDCGKGSLCAGSTYTMTIVTAYDTEGNALDKMPVSWDFIMADPEIVIVKPEESLHPIKINTIEDKDVFQILVRDAISRQPYKAEANTAIYLKASVGGVLRKTGSFYSSNKTKLSGNPARITISQNESQASFYYSDSEVTGPTEFITIDVYDASDNGWWDSKKYIQMVNEDLPLESIVVTGPEQMTVGNYSSPFRIQATNKDGLVQYLPEGKLYLYTNSATGAFYENKDGKGYRKLPFNDNSNPSNDVTIQDVAPQYLDIGPNVSLATIYYFNSATGLNLMAVSDNSPEKPDIGLKDAHVALNIAEIIEDKKIDKELEEVTDDSGRIVDKIKLAPTAVTMLPGAKQNFTATAYDKAGKVINGLKFGWFVLLDKSGTIEKLGHGDSHISAFTASSNLGTYNDTVLVATLYNGKLAYATGSVKIVDVVNYKGPQRLPVTGMNGLQLVLMGLTLMAAVALAWVEHYDKTHFKPENNEN